MTDRYTYKVVFTEGGSGITGEVIPDKAPTIEWKDQDEPVKFFKRKEIGDLTFSREVMLDDGTLSLGNGVVFEYIWDLYFDATKHGKEYGLTIYDEVKAQYEYQGFFSMKDVKLNLEEQTITIKPNNNDEYRWILAGEETEVDIIDTAVGTVYDAKYVYNTEEDIYPITSAAEYNTIILNGATPNAWEWMGTGAPPDFTDQGNYPLSEENFHRYISRYPIDGWTEISRSDAGGYDDPLWVDENPSTWESEEITWTFPNCYKLLPNYTYREPETGNGWVLEDYEHGAIQYILDQVLPVDHQLTLKSEFFSNEINYVTGETNYLMNALIEQKSDAKDPDATNKASIGVITWKKLMQSLMDMFNVRWFIDSDGYLRIEHIKYFKNGHRSADGTPSVCVDLSDVLKYKDPYTDEGYFNDTQRYEWMKQTRPISEYWSFMEEYNVEHRSDFNYIKYSEIIATQMTKKERNIINFTTDIRYIMARPEKIGDDGFVLYDCSTLGEDEGNIRSLIKYLYPGQLEEEQPYYPNAAFGQEHLIPDYWYYDRPYIRGTLYLHNVAQNGGNETDFYDAEKQLLQKDIMFLLNNSDTFDITKYIRSYRYERSLTGSDPSGRFDLVEDEGEIISAKLDLETGYYTVSIAYGIY